MVPSQPSQPCLLTSQLNPLAGLHLPTASALGRKTFAQKAQHIKPLRPQKGEIIKVNEDEAQL
jgi:hypothetical protein